MNFFPDMDLEEGRKQARTPFGRSLLKLYLKRFSKSFGRCNEFFVCIQLHTKTQAFLPMEHN